MHVHENEEMQGKVKSCAVKSCASKDIATVPKENTCRFPFAGAE